MESRTLMLGLGFSLSTPLSSNSKSNERTADATLVSVDPSNTIQKKKKTLAQKREEKGREEEKVRKSSRILKRYGMKE